MYKHSACKFYQLVLHALKISPSHAVNNCLQVTIGKIYIPKKTTISLFTSSFLLQHHCERLIYKTARRFVHSLGGYVLLAIAAYVPVGFFSDSFVRFHNVVGRVVSNLIVPREEGGEER